MKVKSDAAQSSLSAVVVTVGATSSKQATSSFLAQSHMNGPKIKISASEPSVSIVYNADVETSKQRIAEFNGLGRRVRSD